MPNLCVCPLRSSYAIAVLQNYRECAEELIEFLHSHFRPPLTKSPRPGSGPISAISASLNSSIIAFRNLNFDHWYTIPMFLCWKNRSLPASPTSLETVLQSAGPVHQNQTCNKINRQLLVQARLYPRHVSSFPIYSRQAPPHGLRGLYHR